MIRSLYLHFTQRYAVVTEMTVTLPRPEGWTYGIPLDRRVDVLLISAKERVAVEVKVTKADLVADVADPAKQDAWRAITHRHAYAVPKELLETALEVVPKTSGVIAVDLDSRFGVSWARRIARDKDRQPDDLPAHVLQRMCWRLAQAEAHAKGYGWESTTESVEELRAQVKRLNRDLEIETNRRERVEKERDRWRRFAAVNVKPPCGTCGSPLLPRGRRDSMSMSDWRHDTEDQDRTCEELRLADAERRKAAGDRWAWRQPCEPDWEKVAP
jgi:hypothetical protein